MEFDYTLADGTDVVVAGEFWRGYPGTFSRPPEPPDFFTDRVTFASGDRKGKEVPDSMLNGEWETIASCGVRLGLAEERG